MNIKRSLQNFKVIFFQFYKFLTLNVTIKSLLKLCLLCQASFYEIKKKKKKKKKKNYKESTLQKNPHFKRIILGLLIYNVTDT